MVVKFSYINMTSNFDNLNSIKLIIREIKIHINYQNLDWNWLTVIKYDK